MPGRMKASDDCSVKGASERFDSWIARAPIEQPRGNRTSVLIGIISGIDRAAKGLREMSAWSAAAPSARMSGAPSERSRRHHRRLNEKLD